MRRGTRRGLVQAQNRVGIVLLTLTVLALAIGFAAGIATTQAMSESQNQALAGSLSSDLAAFGRAAPDFGATFRQSLWQNVKCFALIALLGMSVAGKMCIRDSIKTFTGSANAAAVAIDALNWPDIVGTIAGDDNILVVVTEAESVPGVIAQFEAMKNYQR